MPTLYQVTTARFWVMGPFAEPVKLSLRKGQSYTHHHGGHTDEGYFSETKEWTFDGQWVTHTDYSRARDCDGLLEQTYISRCNLANLRAGYADEDNPGVVYPLWERVDAHQRDHFAEAMGY